MRHLTTYLAGNMEYARGSGINWRLNETKELRKIFGSNLNIGDPARDESKKTGMPPEEAKQKLNYWKKHNKEDKIKQMMKKVISEDIKAVRRCDFMIVCWDSNIRTYGTIGEIQIAYDEKIPVYFVTLNKLSEISSWLIGEYTEKFRTFKELNIYLKGKYSRYIGGK